MVSGKEWHKFVVKILGIKQGDLGENSCGIMTRWDWDLEELDKERKESLERKNKTQQEMDDFLKMFNINDDELMHKSRSFILSLMAKYPAIGDRILEYIIRNSIEINDFLGFVSNRITEIIRSSPRNTSFGDRKLLVENGNESLGERICYAVLEEVFRENKDIRKEYYYGKDF